MSKGVDSLSYLLGEGPEREAQASRSAPHTPTPSGSTILWGTPPVAPAAGMVEVPVAPELAGLLPGQVVAGRYRVEKWLGTGGSSVVYEAVDEVTQRRVALKVLLSSMSAPAHVRRFLQEVEHARALEHPNIVRVYEAGTDGSRHFLTTELLEGMDLRQRLATGPRPTLAESLRWLTHAAAALEHAHTAGVLHRDVKPGNLFLTRTSGLKLTDFGLAKSAHVPGVTAHGAVLGTPEYMAPEQVSGAYPLSPASDLYSLGVVAYEVLTGQLPFRHPQVVPLMFLHVQQAPCPPRSLCPHLPEPFEQVVLKLLAKRPQQRYASAGELRQALLTLWPLALPPGIRPPLARP
jgi:eukaryotic-like serine/threonine-protein kinase